MSSVSAITDGAERSRPCELVLRSLPEWFGIESAVQKYVREVAELPTFVVRLAELSGAQRFLSLKLHSREAAEVHVMGVRREAQDRGLGTALMAAGDNPCLIMVKRL